jgi:hypothetical protein
VVIHRFEVSVFAAAVGCPRLVGTFGKYDDESVLLGELHPAGLFGIFVGRLPIVVKSIDDIVVGIRPVF